MEEPEFYNANLPKRILQGKELRASQMSRTRTLITFSNNQVPYRFTLSIILFPIWEHSRIGDAGHSSEDTEVVLGKVS